jgi:hypothetical protein
MFIKVNANAGFNPDAVACWHFALVPPPPAALLAERTRATTPAHARGPTRAEAREATREAAREHTRASSREWERVSAEPHIGPPVLTTLAPNTATLGDPSFTLSVQGTNFDDGAVIVWNGSDEVTTFVSATEVTTEVDMATATTAIPISVQVRNLDATLSNTLQFQLVDPPAPPADIPTLTITFVGGGELVFEGVDAEKVRNYYSVPSSHLTVL